MHDVLIQVCNLLMTLSLVLGLYGFKDMGYPLRIVLLQTAVGLLIQVSGGIYTSYFHTNNTPIFNIFIILDLWLMGWLAWTIAKEKALKLVTLAGVMICTVIDIVCIWKMGIMTLANWGFLGASLMFSAIFLSFFLKLFWNNKDESLKSQPMFWLYLSILVYYDSSIPLFGFFNYLIKHHPVIALKTYMINVLLDISRYSLLCIAIWQQRQQAVNQRIINA